MIVWSIFLCVYGHFFSHAFTCKFSLFPLLKYWHDLENTSDWALFLRTSSKIICQHAHFSRIIRYCDAGLIQNVLGKHCAKFGGDFKISGKQNRVDGFTRVTTALRGYRAKTERKFDVSQRIVSIPVVKTRSRDRGVEHQPSGMRSSRLACASRISSLFYIFPRLESFSASFWHSGEN